MTLQPMVVEEEGQRMRLGNNGRRKALVGIAACFCAMTVLTAVVTLAGEGGLMEEGQVSLEQLQQPSAAKAWLSTLKGAESFLDAADKGKLPAKGIVPQSLKSVSDMLQETKDQVHREATRLSAMQEPKKEITMPYGARKISILTGPGEQNAVEGFQGLARRDVRPGQVMREVTDLVDKYKDEEDEAAKELLREIASKIVESFDTHGLSAAQIARAITDSVDTSGKEQAAAGAEMKKENMKASGITSATLLGNEGPDVGVEDCTDNPGLPKSSKFCLEGRPYTKLPGLDSAMTTGDMRGKIKELKARARENMGLPSSDKIDQEELAKLKDIVSSTSKSLEQEEKQLKAIKKSKQEASTDLKAQDKVMSLAKDARKERVQWRHMDSSMTQAYKDAGFTLPMSAGR